MYGVPGGDEPRVPFDEFRMILEEDNDRSMRVLWVRPVEWSSQAQIRLDW